MATSIGTRESLIETIRSLKKMEEQSTNEHEAANAAAMATRLLMKHNLHWEEVDIADTSGGSDPFVEDARIFTNTDGDPSLKMSAWKVSLATKVAKVCLCKAIFRSGDRYRKEPAKFFLLGRRSNVEVADYLYNYLEREISNLGEKAYLEATEARGLGFWNSWHFGAVNEVGRRLEEEMDIFKSASEQCCALVVNRMREVEEFVKEKYPRLGNMRSGATIDEVGYANGAAAGSSVAIRQGIPGHVSGQKFLN